MRIRDDLDGSVFLHTGGPDSPVALFAGDEVPEGCVVGEHLLAVDEPEEELTDEYLAAQLAEVTDNDEGGAVDESEGADASEQPEPTDTEATPPAPVPVEPEPVKRSHKAKA